MYDVRINLKLDSRPEPKSPHYYPSDLSKAKAATPSFLPTALIHYYHLAKAGTSYFF